MGEETYETPILALRPLRAGCIH